MPHGTIAGDTASQLRNLQHTSVEHSGLDVWYTPQHNLRVFHKHSGDTSLFRYGMLMVLTAWNQTCAYHIHNTEDVWQTQTTHSGASKACQGPVR